MAYAPINVKAVGKGGGGGDLIDHFGPGGGRLNYLVVPGVVIFEFFVPVTTFPRVGILLYLTSHLCPGGREFYSNFLANVKFLPYALPYPALPLAA